MRAMIPCLMLAWWFAAAAASAANVRWTGNAQDVAQVSTITASGTWAGGDTATVTCNKKSVTVTLGTAVTTTDVAAALAAAINATDAGTGLVGDETRNVGGQAIPEFAEILASSSGAVLTLRSRTPGVPFTVTRSEATAGDGVLGAVTAVTAATGKHWLSNPDNYEAGALPADDDTLFIDTGSVSILYGLDYFRTNAIDLDIVISNDWLGQLGLPLQNVAGYVEYRPRYFQLRGVGKELEFVAGTSGVAGQGLCWIDCQDQTLAAITCRAARGSGVTPSVFLAGSHDTTGLGQLIIERGRLALEPDDAPTATTKRAAPAAIYLGLPGGAPNDAMLIVGRNAEMTAGAVLDMYSGTLTCHAATTDGASAHRAIRLYGGSAYMKAGPQYTYEVYQGGTLYPDGGSTIDEVRLLGGTLDFRQSILGDSIGKLVMFAGSAAYDRMQAGSIDTVDLVGCRLSQVTLELPPNRQLDVTNDATP